MSQAVFRFAPSPNGELHLGHAYSALLNQQLARQAGAKLLLRIEDIDLERCNPQFEKQMLDDLAWLGIEWDETPRRQSEHLQKYRQALEMLEDEMMVYPASLSRREIRRRVTEFETGGKNWPRDPDGAPVYPGNERDVSLKERQVRQVSREKYALRLDMKNALLRMTPPLFWLEHGAGPADESGMIAADPARWGDVLLGRRDTPASYHLACVIDDAAEGVTRIVRGQDLFHATSVHRLLQKLLGLPVPEYHHHDLILDHDGHKLSKSRKDTSLRQLREAGKTPADIKKMVGIK